MFSKVLKDKRGFTVVEILAVIVLITLLLLVAVPAVGKQLEGVREDYYISLEKSIKTSAQDYISESRYGKPSKLLYSRVIEVDDLVKKNYIDEVKDYLGKDCKGSYVIVVKTGNKSYDYTTCLSCMKDGYYTDTSGNKKNYCDEAWKSNGSDTFYYEINVDAVSIPYGDLDNENLMIIYDIVKKSGDNELFKIENAETLYPENIDVLLNASVGNSVTLEYVLPNGEKKERNVNIISP